MARSKRLWTICSIVAYVTVIGAGPSLRIVDMNTAYATVTRQGIIDAVRVHVLQRPAYLTKRRCKRTQALWCAILPLPLVSPRI